MTDAYSDNERRLLTIAVQRQMLLDETAKAAAVTIRELTEEIRRRDERLAAIAAICQRTRRRSEDYVGGMAAIEAIARGEPPGASVTSGV